MNKVEKLQLLISSGNQQYEVDLSGHYKCLITYYLQFQSGGIKISPLAIQIFHSLVVYIKSSTASSHTCSSVGATLVRLLELLFIFCKILLY